MKFDAKLITEDGISCIIGGKPYNVGTEHPKYKEIEKTLRGQDADKFLSLVQKIQPIKINKCNFACTESVCVGEYEVTYKGEPIHNTVTERLIALNNEGHDVLPLSLFLEKLLKNPSKWCVDALYTFLEAKGLPITEDGDVLAYKVVDVDWMDKYSGTISNKIGTAHEVPRNTVDDDRTKQCSYGFHVGDLTYSGPNGSYRGPASDRTLIVKFSPEDVVAVPEEADAQKIRVCKYTVMSEYKELPNTFVNLSVAQLKHGDKIEFEVFDPDWDFESSRTMVCLKFEGISKRHKGTRFYGRFLAGTEYGTVGQSASFLISEISNLKKV